MSPFGPGPTSLQGSRPVPIRRISAPSQEVLLRLLRNDLSNFRALPKISRNDC